MLLNNEDILGMNKENLKANQIRQNLVAYFRFRGQ
jgi:hypothetical protein